MSDPYRTSLETLWHDYHFRIRHYLKKHMRDDWMTDEMLAIVYYRAVVATANGNGAHTNGGAWLFQIARSAMTDHWRYYRDITFVDFDGLVDHADGDISLDDRLQTAEVSAQVQDAIARLADSQREVIRGRMAGRSFVEIAEERGINYNTAKQIGVRAFASLRKKLVDLEGN